MSLAIIGVAATMITAATSAVFTDQVVSTNNELEAGTLNLTVDGDCTDVDDTGTPCADSFTWEIGTPGNMAIGDEVEHEFDLANIGSLLGDLTITPLVTPTGGSPAGCFTLTAVSVPAVLDELTANNAAAGGTDEATYTVTVTLDASGASAPTDNECQGATADIAITFTLTQQA